MLDHGHPASLADDELLRSIGRGCTDCFALLFHRYCRQVFSRVGPPGLFSRFFSPFWSADDTSLYLVGSRKDNYEPTPITKITLSTDKMQPIASLPANTFGIDEAIAEGNELYLNTLSNGGDSEQVFAFSKESQELTPLVQRKERINSLSVESDGARMAYLAVDSLRPSNVWTWDRAERVPHDLTHFGLDREG